MENTGVMAIPDHVTIRRPDDWHVHFRDGAVLAAVVPWTARQFARAIVMPNLLPPVTTVAVAKAYRERIKAAVPEDISFQPLMTAYLTDGTDPDELSRGHAEDVFTAVKLYPAGATTNSSSGVTDIRNVRKTLERMQEIGMPLLVHGEVTDPAVDIFDREAVFIERVMAPLLRDFPALKIVFEHITTKNAADFVMSDESGRLAATITAHHLVINRSDIFKGGIRPHARHLKETACGCAGIFSAPAALEIYVRVFDEDGALGKLEAFASLNGPAFYGLPVNEDRITLRRQATTVPAEVATAEGFAIEPFLAGETLSWKLTG